MLVRQLQWQKGTFAREVNIIVCGKNISSTIMETSAEVDLKHFMTLQQSSIML